MTTFYEQSDIEERLERTAQALNDRAKIERSIESDECKGRAQGLDKAASFIRQLKDTLTKYNFREEDLKRIADSFVGPASKEHP